MKITMISLWLLLVGFAGAQANPELEKTQTALYCTSAVGSMVEQAHLNGAGAFRLPVFNEALDKEILKYFELTMNMAKQADQVKAASEMIDAARALYPKILVSKPQLETICAELAHAFIGDCYKETDFNSCVQARSNSAEFQALRPGLTTKLGDAVLDKTQMGVLLTARNKVARFEDSMMSKIAPFLMENIITLMVLSVIFTIAMVVLLVRRANRNKLF